MGKKRVSLKTHTGQAASTVGGNAKAKEEDISPKHHPGDLIISSYQAKCNDKKDWPNIKAKDQCGVQVTPYLPYLHLDHQF